jgi:hypothetical protein
MKPDGTYRLCADWRGLNEITEFDTYPMVDIDQALLAMRGAKWISKVDLNKGYHQVPIRKSDRPKTTIVTLDGSYQFDMMGMGLVGASATFQRLLDLVLTCQYKYPIANNWFFGLLAQMIAQTLIYINIKLSKYHPMDKT